MLCLNRDLNERIIIGDDIVVEVIGVKGFTVRLGITAPKDVTIHREEVYRAIQRDQASQEKRP